MFSSQSFRDRGILRPEAALTLLAMHQSEQFDLGHRIWSLFMLEIWARVWIDKQTPEGTWTSLD